MKTTVLKLVVQLISEQGEQEEQDDEDDGLEVELENLDGDENGEREVENGNDEVSSSSHADGQAKPKEKESNNGTNEDASVTVSHTVSTVLPPVILTRADLKKLVRRELPRYAPSGPRIRYNTTIAEVKK